MSTTNPNWEFKTQHDILIACVGTNFGNNPEDKLEEIRSNRAYLGDHIRYTLGLTSTDRVADIGSGCGFVTRAIVPHVAHMWCVDISKDFMEYCRTELSEFSNVSYSYAEYANFVGIDSGCLHACYSTAVFIHFNYYDLIFYLTEVNRVLSVGGKFLFDFLDSDRLDYKKSEVFQRHFTAYRANRAQYIFNILHPLSLRTIEAVAPQVGFEIVRVDFLPGLANNTVILRKVADTVI